MKTRRLHRLLGIILLAPFFGWATTGLVFFLKPGYADAYAMLQPTTYPLEDALAVTPEPGWQEFRYLRTILGEHLLVRTRDGWEHRQLRSLEPWPWPDSRDIDRLLTDAFAVDPTRYGNVIDISAGRAVTDTGIEITIDWDRLQFRQQGRDTHAIDMLYRVHYLQWTGIGSVDKGLGMIGLGLLIMMTMPGARLALARTTLLRVKPTQLIEEE